MGVQQYIYREREREGQIHTYMYVRMQIYTRIGLERHTTIYKSTCLSLFLISIMTILDDSDSDSASDSSCDCDGDLIMVIVMMITLLK